MTSTDGPPTVVERRPRSPLGRAWLRLGAPAGVARARLRSRPGRNLLLVTGIAAAAAMLVAVLGGTTVSRDRSLQHLIQGLPAADRSIRVDLVGLPAQDDRARAEAAVRSALSQLAAADPVRVVAFRDFWLAGEFVRLGAIDGAGGMLRLVSGRFPRRCDASVCEVLQLGRAGKPSLDEGDIHLVRVGVGELRDPAALGPAFLRLRQQRAQASWVTSVVLLGPSTAALERLPSLRLLFRLKSWVLPPAAAVLHEWQIAARLRRESRAQEILQRADPTFALSGPDTALVEAEARGDVFGSRMELVGGSIAVALFGFALVGAVGLRRGLAAERRRLAQRGATRGQIVTATLTEVGAVAAAGWLAGIVGGAVAVGSVAAAAGVPVLAALRHSLLTAEAGIALGAGLLLAVLVLAAVVSLEPSEGRRSRVGPLDVAALGAVLAVAVGLSRGALHAGTGSSTGDGTFLLVLPALVCAAGGLVAARALGPLMVLCERLARGGSIALRLALLGLARAPARTAAGAAFLVVTVGLVVFAGAYRATLDRGARDEAAFAVPLDVTVSSGASLRQPLDVAPLRGYARLARGVRAFPVLRTTVTSTGEGTSVQSPTLLGIPSDAFAAVRWRPDYAGASQRTLAERSRPVGDMALRGVPIPRGARTVSLDVRLRGTPLALALVVRDERGRLGRLPLGTARPGRAPLGTRLPGTRPASRPRSVVALELSLTKAGQAWLLHLAHEGRFVGPPSGVASFRALRAVDAAGHASELTSWGGWIARGRDATVADRGHDTVRLSYSFADATSLYLRPRQPTDDRPVPVVTSPAVAAAAGPGGLLTLGVLESHVRARVVGVARRFPTLGEDEEFVVGDEEAVATALDADTPGTGAPGEVWLSVPHSRSAEVERALSRSPFSGLQQVWRERLYEQARDDPLAHGVETTLGAAALAALVLAIAGLWAALLSDLRDDRDTFFDLEAQGAGPETLRRSLRIRGLALLAFGLVGGILLGLLLSRLVVSLVQVTGAATDPFPPLVLDAGLETVVAALGVLVGAAGLAFELTVRRAFRDSSPERTSWSFE